MKLSKTKACKDIEEIREVTDCGKRRYTGLYKIFLAYGLTQGIKQILGFAATSVWGTNGICGYVNFGIDLLCAAFILFYFFKIYRNEKNITNKYYLSTISIWGAIAVPIPFLMLGVRVMAILFNADMLLKLLPILSEYEMLINMLLICAAIITVGYAIEKRWMTVLAIFILFAFLIVKMISIGDSTQKGISTDAIYYLMVTIFGYICLGLILLLFKEKQSADFVFSDQNPIKSKIGNIFTAVSIYLSALIVFAEIIYLVFKPPVGVGRITWLLVFSISSVIAFIGHKKEKSFVPSMVFYCNVFVLVMSLALFV